MLRCIFAFMVIFAVLLISCLGTAAQESGTKWALVIGVNEYPNLGSDYTLKYAQSDAQAIAKRLREPAVRMPENNLFVRVGQKATKGNIQSVLVDEIAMKVKPNDTVFIYFSGHGCQYADDDSDEQIDNKNDDKDEFILPVGAREDKPSTWIRDDEFNKWIMNINARLIVIAFDCCYAGEQGRGAKGVGLESADLPANFYDDIGKGSGSGKNEKEIVVMAACAGNQRAYESENYPHGLFTYHLLDKFKECRDASVSDEALFNTVCTQVTSEAQNNGLNQTPPVPTRRFINGASKEEFPISEFFPCPRIKFTVVGPYNPIGGKDTKATVKGKVLGVDPTLLGLDSQSTLRVVLYAHTIVSRWYVQPEIGDEYTRIANDGTWERWTHEGDHYLALLVKSPPFDAKIELGESELPDVDWRYVMATTGPVIGKKSGKEAK